MTVELYIQDEDGVIITPETIWYEDGCPPLPEEGQIIYAGSEAKGWKVKRKTFTYKHDPEDDQNPDVQVRLFCELYSM